jgi:hypothetical protein
MEKLTATFSGEGEKRTRVVQSFDDRDETLALLAALRAKVMGGWI